MQHGGGRSLLTMSQRDSLPSGTVSSGLDLHPVNRLVCEKFVHDRVCRRASTICYRRRCLLAGAAHSTPQGHAGVYGVVWMTSPGVVSMVWDHSHRLCLVITTRVTDLSLSINHRKMMRLICIYVGCGWGGWVRMFHEVAIVVGV